MDDVALERMLVAALCQIFPADATALELTRKLVAKSDRAQVKKAANRILYTSASKKGYCVNIGGEPPRWRATDQAHAQFLQIVSDQQSTGQTKSQVAATTQVPVAKSKSPPTSAALTTQVPEGVVTYPSQVHAVQHTSPMASTNTKTMVQVHQIPAQVGYAQVQTQTKPMYAVVQGSTLGVATPGCVPGAQSPVRVTSPEQTVHPTQQQQAPVVVGQVPAGGTGTYTGMVGKNACYDSLQPGVSLQAVEHSQNIPYDSGRPNLWSIPRGRKHLPPEGIIVSPHSTLVQAQDGTSSLHRMGASVSDINSSGEDSWGSRGEDQTRWNLGSQQVMAFGQGYQKGQSMNQTVSRPVNDGNYGGGVRAWAVEDMNHTKSHDGQGWAPKYSGNLSSNPNVELSKDPNASVTELEVVTEGAHNVALENGSNGGYYQRVSSLGGGFVDFDGDDADTQALQKQAEIEDIGRTLDGISLAWGGQGSG